MDVGDVEISRLRAKAESDDERFRLRDGVLYRVGTPTDRLVIPAARGLRELLLAEIHEALMSGHLGPYKTVKALQ
jgi:hypothetical protein